MVIRPWVYLAVAIAFVLTFVGGFYLGDSFGRTLAQLQCQKQLNQMATAEQERRQLMQNKIDNLSKEAADNRAAAYAAEQAKEPEREKIVVQWRDRVVPGTCGLSEATTNMIREYMEIDK